MKMKVDFGYNKNGTYVHTVTFGDRCFENVENIPSCSVDKCDDCKYHSECEYNKGAVRTFDCLKNAKKVTRLYTLITSIIVMMYFWNIFFVQKLNFFRGMGNFILGLVALDIVCTFIETMIPKIRDKRFFNKLVKLELENNKKAQIEKELAEAKRIEDENEKSKKFPYFKDILKAEFFVKNLKSISDEFDFGSNNGKVSECVNILNQIILALKEEPTSYSTVTFLFDGLIEEFYKALKFYSSLLRAGINEKKDDEILGSCVDKFLMHLKSNKVDTILDEKSTKLQFINSAQTVNDLLDKKGEL